MALRPITTKNRRVKILPLVDAVVEDLRALQAAPHEHADLDSATMTLRPVTTKNRHGRILPLVDAIVEDLRPLQGEPDEHVFLTPHGRPVADSYRRVLHRLRELLVEAAIPDDGVDIHSLRHTFCSELARAGVGLTHVQALMEHSDPRLTASLYTHLGVAELRAAVGRFAAR